MAVGFTYTLHLLQKTPQYYTRADTGTLTWGGDFSKSYVQGGVLPTFLCILDTFFTFLTLHIYHLSARLRRWRREPLRCSRGGEWSRANPPEAASVFFFIYFGRGLVL